MLRKSFCIAYMDMLPMPIDKWKSKMEKKGDTQYKRKSETVW